MFNVAHDSSHSAIFDNKVFKYGDEIISRLSFSLILLNYECWLKHHWVHHVFTGNPVLDPDFDNFSPIIMKNALCNPNVLIQIPF